jgi:hypothetical protein
VIEEESYDARTFTNVSVDSQRSFLVDVEEEYSGVEDYETQTEYSVDVRVPRIEMYSEDEQVPYVRYEMQAYDAEVNVPFLEHTPISLMSTTPKLSPKP